MSVSHKVPVLEILLWMWLRETEAEYWTLSGSSGAQLEVSLAGLMWQQGCLWTTARMGWNQVPGTFRMYSLTGSPPVTPGLWLDLIHRQLQCPELRLRSYAFYWKYRWSWLLSIFLVYGVRDKLNWIVATSWRESCCWVWAGTMVSESAAWVQACLYKIVLLGLRLLEDFITF